MLDQLRHFPGILGLALRYTVLRNLAVSCGTVVAIFEGSYLRSPENISLGNNVSIHPLCYLDASGGLTIGNDVSIAHGVTIMTSEHDYSIPNITIRDAPVALLPVKLGSDVWIGAGAKILAGVNIGDRVVIGAGAVVTKDVPSNSVAVGVPARVIRKVSH